MKIDIKLIIGNLLMASTFFPYLSFLKTPFSLQPYSLIFSLFYILFAENINFKIRNLLWLPIISALGALSLAAIGGDTLNIIRSLYNYFAFAILLPTYFLILSNSKIIIKDWIKIASTIYFLTGIIQLLVDHSFMSCCVANIQDQDILLISGRGVASLSPEPTFFGFISCILIFLSYIYKDKYSFIINIISLIYLSRSSLAIACIFLVFTFFIFSKAKFYIKLIAFGVSWFLIYITISVLPESLRIVNLLRLIYNNDISSAFSDESVEGRFYHIITPFISSFDNYFLPFGYVGLPNGDPRILSGFGSIIYELGFIGFPVIFLFFYVYIKINREFKKMRFLYLGFLYLAWLNANQIGMPLFIFFFTILFFGTKKV